MNRQRLEGFSKGQQAALFACALGLLASGVAVAQNQTTVAPPAERLPRQVAPTTGALQGVIRGESGLGVGGAHVVLRNLSTGKEYDRCLREGSAPCTTTGDGVFLMPDLPAGQYELRAELPGFEAVTRSDVELKTGQVSILELTMKSVPLAAYPGVQNVPRLPELGTLGVAPPEEPLSPYYSIRREPEADDIGGELLPDEPVPADERVFTAVPNRWRAIDYPTDYQRYPNQGKYVDVQNSKDHFWDPFNRNKLKGDYPILGNQTFLELLLASDTFADGRRLPTPSGVSANNPRSSDFYGQFGQLFLSENITLSATLFHGDTAFKPVDWQVRFTPEINFNYLAVKEQGIVNIDPTRGTTRYDSYIAGLQEAFAEYKIHDLSHEYDFVSVRLGIQHFNSDFRGFIFNDEEPGIRIFGNFGSNRWQYNVAAFAMLEKDTNSGLNTLNYRHQNVFIANVYKQDFLTPGYTIQASFHYNMDQATVQYDNNDFLVRPAPFGNFVPHKLRAYYYGLTGDGHIKRINVTHAFYQVLGTDSFNEVSGQRIGINAQMAALELSLDKDWLRYRLAGFYSSGDRDPTKGTGHGFDTIFDNPNFAGGIFSFWNREGIRLTGSGVGLVSGDSLVPSLRPSKSQGQASYVNPGLMLLNAGTDIDITTKMRGFINFNAVRFVHTSALEQIVFQRPIHDGVGADSGIGVKYRPPLSDNIVITAGFNAFFPWAGFRDIYTSKTLYSVFTNVRFQF